MLAAAMGLMDRSNEMSGESLRVMIVRGRSTWVSVRSASSPSSEPQLSSVVSRPFRFEPAACHCWSRRGRAVARERRITSAWRAIPNERREGREDRAV